MERILVLRNTVQPYAWGSRTAIPELLGAPSPATEPWAELWMGAHPKAPSRVVQGSQELPLDSYIARDPAAALGPEIAKRFAGALPFLFKVLAAAEPLSLQAHPNLAQARAGFARENSAGIGLDEPRRCYPDANHKPELICALTPFHALCGFRPVAELLAHFDALAQPELAACAAPLRAQGERGLEACFRALWTLEPAVVSRGVAQAAARARGREGLAWRWVERLAPAHPADIGVLAPLLLNLIDLAPGEALFLDAGSLHSYLGGVGVELMASSDNVLRGGLTRKHVDVPALLDTLIFRSGVPAPLRGERLSAGELRYATPAREFELRVVRVGPGAHHTAPSEHGVEILLCTEGEGRIVSAQAGEGGELGVSRGTTLFVPAAAPAYRLEGACTVWKAAVPA